MSSGKRVLIMTAVVAERDAVLRGLRGAGSFDVLAAGVGPAPAAASTAAALASGEYRMVVSAGIGGGFPGQAEIASIVVANEIIAADLGAETPDGFLGLDELGFGSARIPVEAESAFRVAEALKAAGLKAAIGPVLTVSTATGTAATAAELAARIPDAAAEAMEGFGVATAAFQRGLPVLEIRAISNTVGPRDRAAWRIGEALNALESASSVLIEVL
ncbi:futalosine hydrolase [Paenibacillus alkalitolerans]|uniref:futalosine hydrolase n=1 Tax=Paenibacillus alkalitolerans TaxID=2799335 RepID=UPI0018F6D0D9|nr:futalosine hydrolase [Paenibacillus alkalitolerans]